MDISLDDSELGNREELEESEIYILCRVFSIIPPSNSFMLFFEYIEPNFEPQPLLIYSLIDQQRSCISSKSVCVDVVT